ncbi:MAG: SpoIIE family protein phosphatase [Candidatus Hydrogenedentes bacterium]|nr:SpoIIE family protein phosphatase [Candidatus Hydrogenedentota bacterium]
MKRFAVRVALVTSAFALIVAAVLGGALVFSSVGLMRQQAIEAGKAYALLVGAAFDQRHEAISRFLEEPPPPRAGEERPPSGGPMRRNGQARPPLRPDGDESTPPSGFRRQIVQDLEQFATIIDAAQVAVIFEGDRVVKAVEYPEDETLLDDEAILALWNNLRAQGDEEPLVTHRRGSVSVMIRFETANQSPLKGSLIQLRTATVRNLVRSNAMLLTFIAVCIAVGAAFASLFLSRSITKPLHDVVEIAEQYGRGELMAKAPEYGPTETRVLGHVLNTMARSLEEHIAAQQEETRRREQLETELRVAANLQQSLLPEPGVREYGRLRLTGWNRQAKEVGGDFYDYWELGPGKTAVLIGDATGKGMTAALLAARCLSTVQSLSGNDSEPGEILANANRALCQQFKRDGHFVTAALVVVDTNASALHISLAGHCPPLFVSDALGEPVRVSSTKGMPLGVSVDTEFETITIPLRSRSTLLLYSDGLTEAVNAELKQYSEERVQQVLVDHASLPLQDLLAVQHEALDAYLGEHTPSDDATILFLRVEE